MSHMSSFKFNYAIKLSWLKRLLDERNDGPWKSLALKNMTIKEDTFWNCSLNVADVKILSKVTSSDFWTEVRKAWCACVHVALKTYWENHYGL